MGMALVVRVVPAESSHRVARARRSVGVVCTPRDRIRYPVSAYEARPRRSCPWWWSLLVHRAESAALAGLFARGAGSVVMGTTVFC
jgi:hypothetical protein